MSRSSKMLSKLSFAVSLHYPDHLAVRKRYTNCMQNFVAANVVPVAAVRGDGAETALSDL